MILADDERRMLDGQEGPAVQAAMELLVQYGEVLGAERLIDTDNVCGANIFNAQQRKLAGGNPDDVFAQISLDSPGGFEIPGCGRELPAHRADGHARMAGAGRAAGDPDAILDSESYSARHGIHLMNTCTPYQVGNVPRRASTAPGWSLPRSSTSTRCSARGPTWRAGKSTGAAMLTGKIPYWGLHLDENRRGSPTWSRRTTPVALPPQPRLGPAGLLDRRAGARGGHPGGRWHRPTPDLVRLKHFGAAAASSGGVEMYHVPGITAEARTTEEALAGRRPAVEHPAATARRSVASSLRAPERDRLGHRGGPGDDRLPARHARSDPRRRPACSRAAVCTPTASCGCSPRGRMRHVAEQNGYVYLRRRTPARC